MTLAYSILAHRIASINGKNCTSVVLKDGWGINYKNGTSVVLKDCWGINGKIDTSVVLKQRAPAHKTARFICDGFPSLL